MFYQTALVRSSAVLISLLSMPTFARPFEPGMQSSILCPSYCVGTTLHRGHQFHGHGDPGCSFTKVLNAPQCPARDSDEVDEFSLLVSNHRFESNDGFYALDFNDPVSELIEITVGGVSRFSKYIIAGREIRILESRFTVMKLIWIIAENGLDITSGDQRVKLKRVD